MQFDGYKLGDIVRWDGVEFSGSSNMKAFHTIPKEWRRKMRAKVKTITIQEDGLKLVELEMPERVVIQTSLGPKSLWTLTVLVRQWTQEELNYINSWEDIFQFHIGI